MTGQITGPGPKSMQKTDLIKSLAMDFIISQDNEIYLIELQHGFGKVGFRTLYWEQWEKIKKISRQWLREVEPNGVFIDKIRIVARNKYLTYKLFQKFQPRSFLIQTLEHPKLKSFLNTITSPFVIAKPPLGSCGKGIFLLEKEKLLNDTESLTLKKSLLFQEYIFSQRIMHPQNQNQHHMGCLRLIIFIKYIDKKLELLHLPPYWRLAPKPINEGQNISTMTANISRGAIPAKVKKNDFLKLIPVANEICRVLVSHCLGQNDIRLNDFRIMET